MEIEHTPVKLKFNLRRVFGDFDCMQRGLEDHTPAIVEVGIDIGMPLSTDEWVCEKCYNKMRKRFKELPTLKQLDKEAKGG